ncbi:MAG: hypothetical protein HQM14_19985 [SAR324 cluster bacterium]|nr:hypothetical protein [SAR324 cluster bacterium]
MTARFDRFPNSVSLKKGIAYRLIVYILICSSMITLVGTGYQLFLEYWRDINLIEDQMEQIQKSHLMGLINSLWMTDTQQAKVLLEGVVRLPDIQYLEIQSTERVWISAGTLKEHNIIEKRFPMNFSHQGEDFNLGSLYAVATLERVHQQLIDRVLVILMTQGIKTFLVSTFIFFIVQFILTRHLSTMAKYANQLNAKNLHSPIQLSRKSKDDELEEVIIAMNRMRENLKTSYTDLQVELHHRLNAEKALIEHKEHLEEEVEARTAALQKTNEQLQDEIHVRRQAEEQLKVSLQEKEILLQEIHHRVKNNMQVISSLSRLQFRHIKDERVEQSVHNLQQRIQTMSIIHEKLYRSDDIGSIDFSEFVEELVHELLISYCVTPEQISLSTEIEKIHLGVHYAIPCGLIINELVTNSLKYAFSDTILGKISIQMHQKPNHRIYLEVKDNGIGIPDDLDIKNSKSMGLRIVSILIQQIDGEYQIERTGGTIFKFQFEEKKHGQTQNISG